LLSCSVGLLALLVALKPLLLVLRLLDRVSPGVWASRLHRRRRRIGVAVHVAVSLRLFAQGALPEGFVTRLALAACTVLLLAREVPLLPLLLALLALLTLQSLLLLALLLGIQRAAVWRGALLGHDRLNRLNGWGRLNWGARQIRCVTWPAGTGVVARMVGALVTPLITPVFTAARRLRLAGHHRPHGNSCRR
jgi:hypothetical protein